MQKTNYQSRKCPYYMLYALAVPANTNVLYAQYFANKMCKSELHTASFSDPPTLFQLSPFLLIVYHNLYPCESEENLVTIPRHTHPPKNSPFRLIAYLNCTHAKKGGNRKREWLGKQQTKPVLINNGTWLSIILLWSSGKFWRVQFSCLRKLNPQIHVSVFMYAHTYWHSHMCLRKLNPRNVSYSGIII